MRKLLLASCAVVAMAVPGLAAAQSASNQPQASEERSGVVDIVVTAQRREESLQDVPIAVTALGGDQLAKLNVRELSDIALFTPSLSTDPQPASPSFGSAINLRGQATTNTILQLESTVGVYLDGVYIPGQSGFSAANVQDLARVEVLKGPQGTLYGRNTTGGAISITTAAPTDKFEGKISAGAGNYGNRELTGVLNIPLGSNVASRFVATYSNDDGFIRDVVSGKHLGNAESIAIRGAIRGEFGGLTAVLRGDYTHGQGNSVPWQLSDIQSFKPAGIEYAAQKYGAAFTGPFFFFQTPVAFGGCGGVASTPACVTAAQTFGGILAGVPAAALAEPGAGKLPNTQNKALSDPGVMDIKFGGVSLDLSKEIGTITLRSISTIRWLDNIVDQDLDGLPQDILRGANSQYARQLTQELQLQGNTDRLDYILGAFYYKMEDGYERNITTVLPTLNPASPNMIDNSVGTKSLSAFAQATYAITDQLDFTAGLRYTDDKKMLESFSRDKLQCQIPVEDRINGTCNAKFSTGADNVSYLLRLSYQPSNDLLFYAVHSTGFKGGGLNPGSSIPGTYAPFGPEKARNYEIGFKSDLLGRKLRVNMAAYYVDYSGLQRGVVGTAPSGAPFNLISNAAKATIKGIEAEVTIAPTSRVTINMTGSYTDAGYKEYFDGVIDRSAQTFQGVSKWRGSISGNFRLIDGPTSVDLSANYAYRSRAVLDEGDISGDPSDNFQDGYGLAGARLAVRHERSGLEVAFWAKNLFDKRYKATVTDLSDGLGYAVILAGTPRTYGFTISKAF